MILNKIYCEDCINGIKNLNDLSVDLCFTDPPYNVGKNYGVFKDNLPLDYYKSWMKEIITELSRVSNNGIVFFVGSERIKLFWDLLPKAKLIVVRSAAIGPTKGDYFLQYHGLLATAKPISMCKDLWEDVRVPGEGYFFREKRYDIPGLTSLELTKKVIINFSKKGDTILDPFIGSGTTAVACKQLGRNFIGFEINTEYVKIANERLRGTSQIKTLKEMM